MFHYSVLIVCLLYIPQGKADPRTSTRRYKPVIQVTEEIDINDITFTTSAPEFERSPSQKIHSYYNGVKSDGINKGGYSRPVDTSPSVFPSVSYKDSYRIVGPLEKVYTSGQPLVVPAVKYKPYKVFKVQDGFSPVSYNKPRAHDKSKLLSFDLPTTYSETESSKQYLSKVVPFPNRLSTQGSSSFPTQGIKNFVPSPTFSPTVLTQTKSENSQLFPKQPDTKPFVIQKIVDWTKSPKKPYHHVNKAKKIPYNHHSGDVGKKDFSVTSEKLGENSSPSVLHKEPPQQQESFLSEISTLHKGGSSDNNLGGVADSLDLKTGERVEFQMYGMDGPQSYKFGFDTGKGLNRHFRFEERDNEGKVKGHYGYLDEEGKMRIMKYEADPITGFHAGPIEISPDDN